MGNATLLLYLLIIYSMDLIWNIHIDWSKETMAWHESHISPSSAGRVYKRNPKLVIILSVEVLKSSGAKPSADKMLTERVDMSMA